MFKEKSKIKSMKTNKHSQRSLMFMANSAGRENEADSMQWERMNINANKQLNVIFLMLLVETI